MQQDWKLMNELACHLVEILLAMINELLRRAKSSMKHDIF